MKKLKLLLTGLALVTVATSLYTVSAIAGKDTVNGIKLHEVPANKQKQLEDEDQFHIDASKKAQHSKNIKDDPNIPVTIPANQKGPKGILPADAGPFSAAKYTTNNMWVGDINGVDTTVYVGYCTQNPENGFVIVYQASGAGLVSFTPANFGGNYFINSVNGSKFILIANSSVIKGTGGSNGDKIVFDFSTQTFTHSK